MSTPVLDAYGIEIKVGDRVKWIGDYRQSPSIGFVEGFTPQKVRIRWEQENKYFKSTCLKYPRQLAVYT